MAVGDLRVEFGRPKAPGEAPPSVQAQRDELQRAMSQYDSWKEAMQNPPEFVDPFDDSEIDDDGEET